MPRQRIEDVLSDTDGSQVIKTSQSGETVLLSIQDVANLYGVHVQTVYKAVREERIPVHRVGWNYIFVAHELPSSWPGDAG